MQNIPSTTTGLFVYGTLMAPEVLGGLVHRVPALRAVKLRGFHRWCVKDATFPAILKAPANDIRAQVHGLLLEDLTAKELRCLDYYEDEAYERQRVCVECAETGEQLAANAYVWPAALDQQIAIGMEWHYDDWRRDTMASFVRDVVEPCGRAFEEQDRAVED